MRAIILAGGTGTRLSPLTLAFSKQLLPVYDKPMIYYPLSCLMLAGLREILIISTQRDQTLFKNFFSNGENLGLKIEYAVQKNPDGIAEAFVIAKDFIGKENVALILGDNIFYGQSFTKILKKSVRKIENKECDALIFGYPVRDPSRYGVIEFGENKNPKKIIEKPQNPPSNYAVPGLYFYDNSVIQIAQNLKKSSRGEKEITDVNNFYMQKGSLEVELLGRGMAWLDTGTYDSLLEASNFIATLQKRQGFYAGCIEEIALKNSWISKEKLLELSEKYKTDYGEYLKYIAGE
jgi:glucose-1-phosphate thymidylyltransferase